MMLCCCCCRDNEVTVCDCLQDLVRTRKKGRSSRMRAARLTTHSQPSWGPLCGTRPCHMMPTTSSWSTWTWRSSCQRTASPPAQPKATRPRRPWRRHSRHRHPPLLPLPLHRWWTSATAPPPRCTRACRSRPASAAPAQQVGSGC